jgi:hypothetical protein
MKCGRNDQELRRHARLDQATRVLDVLIDKQVE